jgi:hypothetical protein
MTRMRVLVLGGLAGLAGLAGCPSAAPKPATSVSAGETNATDNEQDRRLRLIAELQDEILSTYERDELPDETPMIPPTVGPARIGVGPGDIYVGDDVKLRAPSRWPLRTDSATATAVRSKRLDIHLSADKQISAAWMSDEVSWRISTCGRTSIIPLRMTALYAHDGDRWVQVFEHLSFGRVPEPIEGVLFGREIASADVSKGGALRDDLSRSLAALLSHQPDRVRQVVSFDPGHRGDDDPTRPAPTLVIAPDPDGEWHDEEVVNALLVDTTAPPVAEERRIGTVGRSVDTSTIAYWVGNFVADLRPRPGIAGGKVRLRGTFVFEKRAGTWIVVQGHLSQPIADSDELGKGLANLIYGTSLLSTPADLERGKPLAVACDDGRRAAPATPEAVP